MYSLSKGEMILRGYILLGLHILLLMPAAVLAKQEKEIHFGSVAEDTPAIMHQRLTPLSDYLETAIGRSVTLTLSPNMSQAINSLSNGNVDLAYLTPVAYLQAKKMANVKLMAKVVSNKQAYFRLEIVVREDSPIKKVADLSGKSFAFGDPAAKLQQAVVVNAGMPLHSLGSIAYLGHYDNIVRGVLVRDYDAGIVTDNKARKWDKKGLRVIYSSPKLPPYNIAATGKMDKALFLKFQRALLSLDRSKPDDRRVLDALGDDFDGFERTNDKEYDIVRKLIRPFGQ
jgi:phosphonate transport system substrate-binding protein